MSNDKGNEGNASKMNSCERKVDDSVVVGDDTSANKESNDNGSITNKKLVPQLVEHGITEEELKIAAKVLEAVGRLHPKFRKKTNIKNEKRPRSPSNNVENNNKDEEKKDEKDAADKKSSARKIFPEGVDEYQKANLRPLRKALAGVFELHKMVLFGGKTEDEYYNDKIADRTIKRQKMSERMHQKKYVAETELRRGRIEKLNKLKNDCINEELGKMTHFLIPDGHVTTHVASKDANTKLLTDANNVHTLNDTTESELKGTTHIASKSDTTPIQLPKLRSCYVCKVRFRELHHFYDQLCPSCAKFNFIKRHQSTSLHGKVAVVTGSRVKIGFQTCLKLLRAGCTVVATTRFPNSAAASYRNEPDFDTWKHQLSIYGLDLRDVVGLEAFTRFLKIQYGQKGIDILINNACQTIRRPTAYYTPIVKREQSIWNGADDTHKLLLGGCVEFERLRRQLVLGHSTPNSAASSLVEDNSRLQQGQQDQHPSINNGNHNGEGSNDSTVESLSSNNVAIGSTVHSLTLVPTTTALSDTTSTPSSSPFESTGISHSTAMSQMVLLPDDVGVSSDVLPPGMSDINGQQVDLRKTNSWLLKMDQVSTPEVMECMFINAIAPFVMNSRLKPLMTTPNDEEDSSSQNNRNPPCRRPDRYIINVSAMEGKFYRYKMPAHPHNNMAKAALNMLTRTSSEDLATHHRIYMNSVDTGWINDENPLEKASKIAKTNLFQTPIDEIDAAARILDPIFVGVLMDQKQEENRDKKNQNIENDGNDVDGNVCQNFGEKKKKDYGKFLKDYKETEW